MPSQRTQALRAALAGRATLEPVGFEALTGFADDDLVAAWRCLLAGARALESGEAPLRAAASFEPGERERIAALAGAPVPADRREALEAFGRAFTPYVICPLDKGDDPRPGFLTGYYEPEVPGDRRATEACREPLLARPDNLETFAAGERPLGPDLEAGLRLADGRLAACPNRAGIETGALGDAARPVAFVRDAIEAFMIHVQGSARLRCPDGTFLRLTYAGRNGHPYSSIGRMIAESGAMTPAEMTLDRLKAHVRALGQGPGEAGRALMQRNRSFIFFSAEPLADPARGPTGGAGLPLTPLRSIAADRNIWPYGLPFWIDADLPWRSDAATPFRRLMMSQDTGSAILGPARADLYFGTGDACGQRAAAIRHKARMVVLLPKVAE